MNFIEITPEYIKKQPPYILELTENKNSIHSSWFDNSYKEKSAQFNNCLFGLRPSMILASEVKYSYNGKIYKENEINLLHCCPGTGASLQIFANPENPYNDPKNWSLTGRRFG